MTIDIQSANPNEELQQLLCRRPDVWRGHVGRPESLPSLSTGHPALDAALIHSGWPKHSLIEVCQGPGHIEWQLLAPMITETVGGYIVLINPPARPFAPALIHMGVDLDRLIVIDAAERADWIMAVLQVLQTAACHLVVAWQPKQGLSYTQLRKCQLAAMDASGLFFLFRPEAALEQASPAALRVRTTTHKDHFSVTVTKQRGLLGASSSEVCLPLPRTWRGGYMYQKLHQPIDRPVKPLRIPHRHLRSV